MTHHLKTHPEFYVPIIRNVKRFEIRRNDRNFHVGDKLVLQEFDPTIQDYTGRQEDFLVTYMTDFQQQPGFVVMGIEPCYMMCGETPSRHIGLNL